MPLPPFWPCAAFIDDAGPSTEIAVDLGFSPNKNQQTLKK
jgi:hypothetical protein